ncbi:MAG: acetyl-CoA carboxylase biotin carboxyl carrier protein [Thermoguttaceae bacterium]|nr:acetyl-CoA carboxylase biotin carboxyl carrier protein [Thermoguttaceae bacterium]
MAEKNDDVFDLNGIRSLVELMKENDVSELDLEQKGSRLSLRRTTGAVTSVVEVAPQAVAPQSVAPTNAPAAPTAPAAPAKDPDRLKTIKAPMVGVFYASSSPEAAPFVKVGDVVTPEKTVCIIEAMKVFNDIPAEISGKIVEVLAQNGDPVEYGSPLFRVDVR